MRVRFDQLSFDSNRGLFDSNGRIPLEPQAFELLGYLIENRDRVISRDELNERIWRGRVVSEAALSTQIRSVRRALGDDGVRQKFVRTFPKRGFQFVAPVQIDAYDDDRAQPRQPERPSGRRTWRLIARAAAVSAIAAAAAFTWISTSPTDGIRPLPKLSLAVLPFDNLSGDADQEYFADAITEDLITDLSRIRETFVIARRTSFTYKGESTDIKEVASELGVRYVVEGSVRRSGEQVRITAQLIDGRTNRHLWSGRFDRELGEAFSLRQDVTGRIAAVLKAELREADSRDHKPPANFAAWDYALQGNVLLFNPAGPDDYRKAKSLLDKAVQLDPTLSSAWSGLAFIHFAASMSHIPGISAPTSKDLSLAAAQKAVTLDPKNAEGHWMIGVGFARNGEPARGFASCETAIYLNPNNDCAYVCAGLTQMALGNPAEALPHFRHSLRLNPRFRPFTKHKYMALAYIHSGQENQAIDEANRAIAASPRDPLALLILASAQALSGRIDKAHVALDQFLAQQADRNVSLARLRESYSWTGPGAERFFQGLLLAGLAT